MSRGAVPVTAKDFGITALKRQAKVRDAEGVVQSARLVLANMRKYLEPLAQQGLTDAMTNDFAAGIDAIVADNRLQYDIVNNRKATVQANLDILNELYRRIMEICIAGKILFGTNAGKLKEYTFSELKKQVRHTSRKPGTDGQSAKNEGRPAQ